MRSGRRPGVRVPVISPKPKPTDSNTTNRALASAAHHAHGGRFSAVDHSGVSATLSAFWSFGTCGLAAVLGARQGHVNIGVASASNAALPTISVFSERCYLCY
jgi:hypothetical protein